MGLSSTPSGERTHIGFFGVRNAGKSSVVNAVTGQSLAVVSDTLGTTTDPVKKAMEILPLGPVVIIDTPGIDDTGELGSQRVERARRALRTCDITVLVVDATRGLTAADQELLAEFELSGVPHIIAWNKADLLSAADRQAFGLGEGELLVSADTHEGIDALKELLAAQAGSLSNDRHMICDLLDPGDAVVLVIPIDESAPRGRIILPQQMVLRECLDYHVSSMVCQADDLSHALAQLSRPPRAVITDSQAFGRVSEVVPADVWLTSFSILMARYRGNLAVQAQGARALAGLTDASHVLVSEGCTHHRQCKDIGTYKIPRWIEGYTGGARPHYDFTSGNEFPGAEGLGDVDLVIQCGGCMLNEREMQYRIRTCQAAGVPMVNYGMAIAQMHGILARSLEPFAAEVGAKGA